MLMHGMNETDMNIYKKTAGNVSSLTIIYLYNSEEKPMQSGLVVVITSLTLKIGSDIFLKWILFYFCGTNEY